MRHRPEGLLLVVTLGLASLSTGPLQGQTVQTRPSRVAQSELEQFADEMESLRTQVADAIGLVRGLPGPSLDADTRLDEAVPDVALLAKTLRATLPLIRDEIEQLDTAIGDALIVHQVLERAVTAAQSAQEEACRLGSRATAPDSTASADLIASEIASTRTTLGKVKRELEAAQAEVERASLAEKTDALARRVEEVEGARRLIEHRINPVVIELDRARQQLGVVEVLEGGQGGPGLLGSLTSRMGVFQERGLDQELRPHYSALVSETEQLRQLYRGAKAAAGNSWRAERMREQLRSGGYELMADGIADVKWAAAWLRDSITEHASKMLGYSEQLAASMNLPERPALLIQQAEACLGTASGAIGTASTGGSEKPASQAAAASQADEASPADPGASTASPSSPPAVEPDPAPAPAGETPSQEGPEPSDEPDDVSLPPVFGKKLGEAIGLLTSAGLGPPAVDATQTTDEKEREGEVVDVQPRSGLRRGSVVTLWVLNYVEPTPTSPGDCAPKSPPPEGKVCVPNVTGRLLEDAVPTLEGSGLVPVIIVGDETKDGRKRGRVQVQAPAPPAAVSPGSDVQIRIFTAAVPGRIVPKVTGMTVEQARAFLEPYELFVDPLEGEPAGDGVSKKPGVIYEQYPPYDEKPPREVPRGTGIRVTYYQTQSRLPMEASSVLSVDPHVAPWQPSVSCPPQPPQNCILYDDASEYRELMIVRPPEGWPREYHPNWRHTYRVMIAYRDGLIAFLDFSDAGEGLDVGCSGVSSVGYRRPRPGIAGVSEHMLRTLTSSTRRASVRLAREGSARPGEEDVFAPLALAQQLLAQIENGAEACR